MVLARAAVCGPVLEHGGSGRGFIQQTTLCKQRKERDHTFEECKSELS